MSSKTIISAAFSDNSFRGTGRTHRLLLAAIAAAAKGKSVCVVVGSQDTRQEVIRNLQHLMPGSKDIGGLKLAGRGCIKVDTLDVSRAADGLADFSVEGVTGHSLRGFDKVLVDHFAIELVLAGTAAKLDEMYGAK